MPNPGPCVVWANHHQFVPGEAIRVDRLESRMLLWCRHGFGSVIVDGSQIALEPSSAALLPWGVRIFYQAARISPFELGGVHLIPHCSGAWQPGAAHGPEDEGAGSPLRADAPGLPQGLVQATWEAHPSLHHLAEHVAVRWMRSPPDEVTARNQGFLLAAELSEMHSRASDEVLPRELSRMLAAMRARIDRDWTLDTLAAAAGCSPAWLTRLSARHLRRSPRRHLALLRLERACDLLRASPTNVTVAAVGLAVGLPDQARFAKVFRFAYGVSPSAWRRLQTRM